MIYEPIKMLTLQDADAAALKLQTMKRICGVFGVPPAMIGVADQKYNNTQTMLDEFYKSTMYPLLVNVQQKLKQHLFNGYPNLYVEFSLPNFSISFKRSSDEPQYSFRSELCFSCRLFFLPLSGGLFKIFQKNFLPM